MCCVTILYGSFNRKGFIVSLGGVSSIHINLKKLRKGDNSYFLGSEAVHIRDEWAPATALWRFQKNKIWLSFLCGLTKNQRCYLLK